MVFKMDDFSWTLLSQHESSTRTTFFEDNFFDDGNLDNLSDPLKEMKLKESVNSSFNNQINFNFDDTLLFDSLNVRITFIVLYTIVFCSCFIGNLMVILVVCLHWRMRSITNFFLANLAIADFCVGVFCIYQNLSIYLIQSWVLGNFLCKMYHFIERLSHTASILILVVICIERYLAIIHPMKCKQILTLSRLRLVIITVWILSAIINSPRLYYFRTISHQFGDEVEIICGPDRRLFDSETSDIFNLVVLYLIPLVLISVLYTRIALVLHSSSKNFLSTLPKSPAGSPEQSFSNSFCTQNELNIPQTPTTPTPILIIENENHSTNNRNRLNESTSISPSEEIVLVKIGSQNSKRFYHHRTDHRTGEIVGKKSKTFCFLCTSTTSDIADDQEHDESIDLEDIKEKTTAIAAESSLTDICEKHKVVKIVHKVSNSSNSSDTQNTDLLYKVEKMDQNNGKILLNSQNSLMIPKQKLSRKSTKCYSSTAGRSGLNSNNSERALKSRRRVIRMLIIIVVSFTVCNLPFHSRKMWQLYAKDYNAGSKFSTLMTVLSTLIMYANSAVSWIFYAFFSSKFRSSFADFLCCKLKKRDISWSKRMQK